MAVFHNRKLFHFSPSSSSSQNTSSSSSSSSGPCYEFCDPSCSNFDDCYYFPDPPDPLPPPPLPPPLPPAVGQVYQISPIIIIAAVIVATVFLLVSCCACVLKCLTSWTCILARRAGSNDPDPPRHGSDDAVFANADDHNNNNPGGVVDHPIWLISTVGLQQSVINSITVVRYKKEDGLIEGTDCSVCLGEFQEGESLRLLPKCNHAFHIDCIDPWLRSHTNCPLCRASIIVVEPLPQRPRSLAGSNELPGWTYPQDSDSSDVELGRGRVQTGEGSGMAENSGNDDGNDHEHEVVENDQNKAEEDETVNNNGVVNGSLVLGRRSFSSQFFRGSNSSPFRSVGSSSSSSWRPQPGLGPGPGPGPIKRSYSWSERVFGTTNNNQECNSRFSP